MPEETVTLYRAVREHEIAVIDELRFRAFPPRRETYPYSDPTHDEAQARRLTENMMNRLGMKQSCILDFEMKKEFADQLKIDLHDEVLKVENLTELNLNIVTPIGVLVRLEADGMQGKTRMLEITDLHASVGGTEILKGLSLIIPAGEVHAIMGPNGSGKSTLSYVLAGREGYEVTAGSIVYNGQDLTGMDPEERAATGVFLAFQYPIEIPGVANLTFLKTALNAQRKARGEDELDTVQFMKFVKRKARELKITDEMLKRPLNVGFSGGEKKRNEILQMAVLEPQLAILDETDSGLDIDALKTVAEGVNALRSETRAMLVITHYQRLLDHIVPDVIHVMARGRIHKSGGKELAHELEKSGYAEFEEAAA